MEPPERPLHISEPAEIDYLDALRNSVESWGRDRAAKYKSGLDATMDRLLEYPEIRHQVGDLFDGGRRVRVEHHWMYYTFTHRVVTIHRILHERRHLSRDLFDVE